MIQNGQDDQNLTVLFLWIRLPRSGCPKSWDSIPDPVVLSERHVYGHPSAGWLWRPKLREVLLEEDWEKVRGWEMLEFTLRRGSVSLSVRGRYQNGRQEAKCEVNVEKTHERNVIQEESTPLLDWIRKTWDSHGENVKPNTRRQPTQTWNTHVRGHSSSIRRLGRPSDNVTSW